MRSENIGAAWLIGVFALLIQPAAQAVTHDLAALIDAVVQRGREGQLPPHLSFVLGIGDGTEPLRVRQAVMREGAEVRVFNVSAANRGDIVLLRTDETRRFTQAYLVSSTGALRNAVSFEAGEQPRRSPPAEAAAAVEAELSYWVNMGRPTASSVH